MSDEKPKNKVTGTGYRTSAQTGQYVPTELDAGNTLGPYLRSVRRAAGMTLRQVESETGVSNAYISQIESGKVAQPSPEKLRRLANAYGAGYGDLMRRAGHPLPDLAPAERLEIPTAGIPLHTLAALSRDEQAELRDFVAYLHFKRRLA